MFKLDSLPNKHGFEFVGIKKDGTEIDCWVYKEVVWAYVVYYLQHNNEMRGMK